MHPRKDRIPHILRPRGMVEACNPCMPACQTIEPLTCRLHWPQNPCGHLQGKLQDGKKYKGRCQLSSTAYSITRRASARESATAMGMRFEGPCAQRACATRFDLHDDKH